MIHYVLLYVPKPGKADYSLEPIWKEYGAKMLELSKPNKNIQFLGENVLLIKIEGGLHFLGTVLSEINLGLPYKYAVLNEEIEWNEVPKRV
jgi:hypothetical protein